MNQLPIGGFPRMSAPDFKNDKVDMTHGGGGRAMAQLIEHLFRASFANPILDRADDQAQFAIQGVRLAMTTDSYVISPLFFPGGDIGSLAVHGTVNDLAMAGAKPLYLTAGFILEEGFPLTELQRIVHSMAAAAQDAGVQVVTGDTKVVERGKGDGVYINTAGVGIVPDGVTISGDRACPGDKVIVSGTIGDHGVAIMALRSGMSFETAIRSDSAPLYGLVARMLDVCPGIRVLRDPTRGGVAATLNEIAQASRIGVLLNEAALPIRPEVFGACELLGLDPLNVANEGKLIAIVPADKADAVIDAMHCHRYGKDAAVIGSVVEDANRFVRMRTRMGGERVVDWLNGEQLPRIC